MYTPFLLPCAEKCQCSCESRVHPPLELSRCGRPEQPNGPAGECVPGVFSLIARAFGARVIISNWDRHVRAPSHLRLRSALLKYWHAHAWTIVLARICTAGLSRRREEREPRAKTRSHHRSRRRRRAARDGGHIVDDVRCVVRGILRALWRWLHVRARNLTFCGCPSCLMNISAALRRPRRRITQVRVSYPASLLEDLCTDERGAAPQSPSSAARSLTSNPTSHPNSVTTTHSHSARRIQEHSYPCAYTSAIGGRHRQRVLGRRGLAGRGRRERLRQPCMADRAFLASGASLAASSSFRLLTPCQRGSAVRSGFSLVNPPPLPPAARHCWILHLPCHRFDKALHPSSQIRTVICALSVFADECADH